MLSTVINTVDKLGAFVDNWVVVHMKIRRVGNLQVIQKLCPTYQQVIHRFCG